MNPAGLRVAAIDPETALAHAGVRAGDAITAIDGLVPRDLIDLQLDLPAASGLTLQRPGEAPLSVDLRSSVASVDGLVLADPMPGGIRECNNHCEFCFIRGLPRGLRGTLYVFDDDYRYSFLWGSFLTLTNLEPADWARIGFQRLSPLNVSVHATDPDVRRRLLNNRHAPPILPQLRRLGRLGVHVHAQVVLCAGLNDDAILNQTIADLADLYPTVQAAAVVPVGLTRFSRVHSIRRPTLAEAAAALALCERWHEALRQRLGVGLVYASDELFALAGRADVPPSDWYDGYPVLTNGVGMMRSMLDDWDQQLARRRRQPTPRGVAWLTGPLAAPALNRMADSWERFAGWRPAVHVVDNRFFGEGVSVSGLLAGADLVATLRALPPDLDDVVLPRGAFGFDGQATLDGIPSVEVGAAHRGRVHLAATPAELLDILTRR